MKIYILIIIPFILLILNNVYAYDNLTNYTIFYEKIYAKTGKNLEYFFIKDNSFIKLIYDKDIDINKYYEIKGKFIDKDVFYVYNLQKTTTDSYPKFIVPITHPTTGNQIALVVRTSFSNLIFDKSINDIKVITNRLIQYYKEVSFGKVNFTVSIYPKIVNLTKTIEYYGNPCGNQVDCRWNELINDIINAIDNDVNFEIYYRIIIIHAGNNEAFTKNSSDIWSFSSLGEWKILTNEGYVYVSFSVLSKNDPLGVFVHEVAHTFGLPDLYLYSEPKSLVGRWDLMDLGAFNGEVIGSVPSHMNFLLKYYLGWVPDIPTNSSPSLSLINYVYELPKNEVRKINLLPHSRSDILNIISKSNETNIIVKTFGIKIPISNNLYYFIEARTKNGFDTFLPNEGILIYLVDENKKSGEGPFILIDSKPFTKTLDDANFNVGEKYEDQTQKILISILNKKITYSNETIYFTLGATNNIYSSVIKFEPEKNIANIYENIRLKIKISLNTYLNYLINNLGIKIYDGEKFYAVDYIITFNLKNLTKEISISINVTNSKVELKKYYIDSILYNDIPLIIEGKRETQIIWDAIEVYNFYTKTQRTDVGKETTIYLKLRYAYNKVEFDNTKGSIKINNIDAKYTILGWEVKVKGERVGKEYYNITYIKDNLYGLNQVIYSISNNYIIWDRLTVFDLSPNYRVEIGKNATVLFRIKSEYDSTLMEDGSVKVKVSMYIPSQAKNFEEYINAKFDKNKRYWYVILNSNEVSRAIVEIVEVKWNLYNITSFKNTSFIEIIFDRILLLNFNPSKFRIETNSSVKVYIDLVYEYDYIAYNKKVPLENGSIVYINNLKAQYDPILGKYFVVIYSDKIEKVILILSKVNSFLYNITKYSMLEDYAEIIFDKINYEINYENALFYTAIRIKVFYEYNKEIVKDVKVILDGNQLKLDKDEYVYIINSIFIYYNFKLSISKEGFKTIENNIEIINYHNLIFLNIVLIILIFFVFYLYMKIKKIKVNKL